MGWQTEQVFKKSCFLLLTRYFRILFYFYFFLTPDTSLMTTDSEQAKGVSSLLGWCLTIQDMVGAWVFGVATLGLARWQWQLKAAAKSEVTYTYNPTGRANGGAWRRDGGLWQASVLWGTDRQRKVESGEYTLWGKSSFHFILTLSFQILSHPESPLCPRCLLA